MATEKRTNLRTELLSALALYAQRLAGPDGVYNRADHAILSDVFALIKKDIGYYGSASYTLTAVAAKDFKNIEHWLAVLDAVRGPCTDMPTKRKVPDAPQA